MLTKINPMKKINLLLIVITLSLSCENTDETKPISFSELSTELNGKFQSNRLEVQTTEDSEIMILQQSSVKSNVYETAYVLQTEEQRLNIQKSSSKESILFENAILIKSESELVFFGVDLDENIQLLRKLQDKIGNQKIVSYFGYGFSKIKGEWSVGEKSLDKSAYSYLGKSNKLNKSGREDAGGGGIICTSGGPGSTSCSIGTEVATIGTSCSVSCSAGYYACCKSSNTTCKCIKEPVVQS